MLIRAVVAGILAQCRREADTRSPEAERHLVGPPRGHTATGAAVIGAVATGMVATGAAAIGDIMVDSLETNPFLSADLVFRSSMGIPITVTIRTIITTTVLTHMGTGMTLRTVTAMVITAVPLTGTATTAVKGTGTAVKDMATATKATAMAVKGTAMAIKGTDTAIKAAATTIKPTAMAINLRLSSYSAG